VLSYAQSIFDTTGRTVVAYATDGLRVRSMTVSASGPTVGALKPLDGEFLHAYARTVVGTSLRALSAENLVERFSGPGSATRRLATALYEALSPEASVGRTQMLFSEWQLLFKLAHDDSSKQKALEDRRRALQDAVGVRLDSQSFMPQYRALFALQTAYSIVLKCIGMNVLQGATKFGMSVDLVAIAEADRPTVQRFLASVEDGSDLRERGVENLLEGDFFSWYAQADQFTDPIYSAVQPVLREIAEFEGLPAFHGDRVAAQDLFKDLYMHMIPEKVRHSLGEYYTPSWLADDTIGEALAAANLDGRPRWRLLDPTCGSGTFLTMAMQRVFQEDADRPPAAQLSEVLDRVVGIDLNPLAVLTARMNYFINISPLLETESRFHIPVYLGDASVTPAVASLDGVDCLTCSIRTLKGPLEVTLPRSVLNDVSRFTTAMADIEVYTKARNPGAIRHAVEKLIDAEERTDQVRSQIDTLADTLVALEDSQWNGIWPRIIADFLTTAALGEFDVIAGNPPWIDWKNLPENYRRKLVDLCVERGIFSGDGVTGGINLNVCALITLTAADNWLKPGGALAFLMPDSLLVQQSYEGFRNLKLEGRGERLYLARLTDWRRAGHPFKPVQQRFCTYVFTASEPASWPGVPVREMVKARHLPLPPIAADLAFRELDEALFAQHLSWAEPVHPGRTYFTRGADASEVRAFSRLAGDSPYRGREGIEFYPQELMLYEYVSPGSSPETAVFRNFQSSTSKHRVPPMTRELETSMMRPLIKGPMVDRFGIETPRYYVPFYYAPDVAGGRAPVPLDELLEASPRLARLLLLNRGLFESQTDYNQRIIGAKHATEFYAVARVGAYSHAPVYVCYRDNTKWGASVVGSLDTPWGGRVPPVFQNHAVTICERPDSSFISEAEAHYICAILNSGLVTRFIEQSSENRSYKIRVPVSIPLFDPGDETHARLSALSVAAHAAATDGVQALQGEIDALVLGVFG